MTPSPKKKPLYSSGLSSSDAAINAINSSSTSSSSSSSSSDDDRQPETISSSTSNTLHPQERRGSTASELVSSIKNIFSSSTHSERPRTPDMNASPRRSPEQKAKAPPKTPDKKMGGKGGTFHERFYKDEGSPTPDKSGKKKKWGKKGEDEEATASLSRSRSATNISTIPRKSVSFGPDTTLLTAENAVPKQRRNTVTALPSIRITDVDPATVPLPPTPTVIPAPLESSPSLSSQQEELRGLEVILEVPLHIKQSLTVLEHLCDSDVINVFYPKLLQSVGSDVEKILTAAGVKEHEANSMTIRHIGKQLLTNVESTSSTSDRVSNILLVKVFIDGDGGGFYYTSRIKSEYARAGYFQMTKIAIAELKAQATAAATTTPPSTSSPKSSKSDDVNVLTRSPTTLAKSTSLSLSSYLQQYTSLSSRLSSLPLFGNYSAREVIDIYISVAECMPPIGSLSLYNMSKLRSILDDIDNNTYIAVSQLNMDDQDEYTFTENLRRRIRRERKGYLETECYWKSEGFFIRTRELLKRLTGAPRGSLMYAGMDDGMGGEDEGGNPLQQQKGEEGDEGDGDEESVYEEALKDALDGGVNEGSLNIGGRRYLGGLRGPRFDGGCDSEDEGGVKRLIGKVKGEMI